MTTRTIVGTCGFPSRKELIFENLDAVEIQETFYNPIGERRIETLLSLKPKGFTYTVKAWQVITHEFSSPTWKRLRKRPEGTIENYGSLKPTKENFSALQVSIDIASRLNAPVLVLQTPPGMRCENRWNEIGEFFRRAISMAKNNGIIIAWEPRGECKKHRKSMEIASMLELVLVNDIGREEPIVNKVGEKLVIYSRLHGIGGKEVNYKYKYKLEDLEDMARKLTRVRYDIAYVLFNNIYMVEDAIRFKDIIRGQQV